MRKLLLINPPYKEKVIRDYYCGHFVKGDYFWAPIDLVMLSRLDEFEIKVIDFAVEDDVDEKIIEAKKFGPDIIVGLVWEKILASDLSFLKKLRETTGSGQLIIIGDATKFNSPTILNNQSDFCVLQSFYNLKDAGLGSYSLPKHTLFPLEKYRMPYSLRNKVATVLTTYACPFKCKFCNSGSYPYQELSLGDVVAELKLLRDIGIKEIYFRDFTFTANEKRVRTLCQLMHENNLKFDWSCDGRVDVSYETLIYMKKAGCYLVFFGVESINDETLKTIFKGITAEMIKKTCSNCKKLGIEVLASFIVGLPGEGEKEVYETLKFAQKYCNYASFNTFEKRVGAELQTEKGSVELTKRIEKEFYLRPLYVIKSILAIRSRERLKNFIYNGLSILKK